MYFQFASVLVFMLLGMALVALMTGLELAAAAAQSGGLASWRPTSAASRRPGSAWINFNIRFYLVALIFVIFDVEVAFIYPVAVVFREWVLKGKGSLRLSEILIFLGILFVGLVYVWVKRDLEWLKRVPVGAAQRTTRMREAA